MSRDVCSPLLNVINASIEVATESRTAELMYKRMEHRLPVTFKNTHPRSAFCGISRKIIWTKNKCDEVLHHECEQLEEKTEVTQRQVQDYRVNRKASLRFTAKPDLYSDFGSPCFIIIEVRIC